MLHTDILRDCVIPPRFSSNMCMFLFCTLLFKKKMASLSTLDCVYIYISCLNTRPKISLCKQI